MQINRYNYEEYFLLYTDNELSAQERAAVEKFAAGQPDLQEELNQLQQYKIVPEKMVFSGKNNLIKHTGNLFIHTDNYEECFLLYADNELNEQQKLWVEEFVRNHAELQPAFTLINKAVLTSDNSISFPEKKLLYRKEDNKVIPFAWWKLAAAAAVVLIAGALWWNGQQTEIQHPIAQQHTLHKNQQSNKEGQEDQTNHTPSLISHDNPVPKRENPVVPAIQQADPAPAAPVERALAKQMIKPMRRSQPHLQNVVQPSYADPVALNTINPSTAVSIREPITDKAAVFSDQVLEDVGDNNVTLASGNDTEDLYITNVLINKKNPLRGLFRKASRFINKTTGSNGSEKTILIGNIEVALK